MLLGMFSLAILGVGEPYGGWHITARRSIIARIGPEPPGLGLAGSGSQHRNGRVIGVYLRSREHMLAQLIDQGEKEGQPNLRDLLVLRLEENRADQAVPRSSPRSSPSVLPPGPIPKAFRDFGKFPNLDQWRPADLLLVASITPDAALRQIISAQARGGYAPEDARWQHAAVYIGEGYVVEATIRGVRYAPSYPYLGGHCLRLRRPLDLSDDDRWKIAIQASVRSNERYAMQRILRLLRLSFEGYWKRQRGFPIAQTKSVICSQLYADAYSRVTGRLATPP